MNESIFLQCIALFAHSIEFNYKQKRQKQTAQNKCIALIIIKVIRLILLT